MRIKSGADEVTPRQLAIFEVMYRSARDAGHMPTVGELMARFGVRSKNSIAGHLLALRRKGYLGKSPASPRSYHLLRRPDGRPFTGFTEKD